jgi:hypothetical protein
VLVGGRHLALPLRRLLGPVLERRLSKASLASSDRGGGPLEQRCRRVARGNLALVGDESGSLDEFSVPMACSG